MMKIAQSLFVFLALSVTTAAFAHMHANESQPLPSSITTSPQWGVGMMFDGLTGGFGVSIDAQNSLIEGGVNYSSSRIGQDEGANLSLFFLGAYVGFRQQTAPHLYGSVGVMFNRGFYTGDSYLTDQITDPYTVGPYIGVAYQPIHRVAIFARIMPYSYSVNTNNIDEHKFFQAGQIGFKIFV